MKKTRHYEMVGLHSISNPSGFKVLELEEGIMKEGMKDEGDIEAMCRTAVRLCNVSCLARYIVPSAKYDEKEKRGKGLDGLCASRFSRFVPSRVKFCRVSRRQPCF